MNNISSSSTNNKMLLLRISQLPQEICILISEFNAEHRPQMKKVFKQYMNQHICMYCKDNILKYNIFVYFKKEKHYDDYFCDDGCYIMQEQIDREDEERDRYCDY